MTKHETYLDADHDTDQLRQLVAEGKLPASAIVTGEQLLMKPGQTLAEKARELGTTTLTLRMWHLEHRGSGYDPDYVIRTAGHSNWGINRWSESDWVALVRTEIAKERARHIGDVLLACGITATNAQVWSQRHAEFEKALWHSGVRYPAQHWRDYVAWIRHPTIEDYRRRLAEHLAQGMPETEARHLAGDEAVNDLKHKTRQRRRVERDQILGVTMHEEMTRRWQKGGRLWDAHSRRIGKRLLKVSRDAAMERGLREAGYSEPEIEAKISELQAAFERSQEDGQAKWQKLRKGILRKKAHREAKTRADQAEVRAIAQLPGVKATKHLKHQLTAR